MEQAMHLEVVNNELATQTYTKVLKDIKKEPNSFLIRSTSTEETLAEINFQTGPVAEAGNNGVFNEDLIVIVLERLKFFQAGKFACKSNDEAIIGLEAALVALRKRTDDRKERHVLGTYEV